MYIIIFILYKYLCIHINIYVIYMIYIYDIYIYIELLADRYLGILQGFC